MAGGEGRRGSSGKAFVVAGMAVAAPLLTVVVVLLCLVILVVAILQSDYNMILGCITISIVAIASATLIVDLIYPFIDPRIRYG